jgi:hypothetical protein
MPYAPKKVTGVKKCHGVNSALGTHVFVRFKKASMWRVNDEDFFFVLSKG